MNFHRVKNIAHCIAICLLTLMLCVPLSLAAQDQDDQAIDRPVRSTFGSIMLIDNHTVMVPYKGTFEFDIQHRFGTMENGFEDFLGFYAPSNIRLGLSYVPIEDLMVGAGFTKLNNYFDLWGKYALLKQTESGKIPVSVTYYGNVVIDAYAPNHFGELYNSSDRFSYFHQVMIARKFSDRISLQVAPSLSHFNIIDFGLENDHIAVSLGGKIGISPVSAVIFNFDQPVTKHEPPNNPNPNLSLGFEVTTSSHAFQIFIGNYQSIIPQENHFFNRNNWEDGFSENFLIGFNITRLWNF